MRFSNDFRNSVGFILENDTPVGTFFLLRFNGSSPCAGLKPGTTFMVTARHCVDTIQPTDRKVRYRGPLPDIGGLLPEVPEWAVPEWHFPSDPNLDLAVAVFQRPTNVPYKALPAEYSTPEVGRTVELGELVYYVGLWDISALGNRGAVPLVRSAIVAAFDEPEIKYGTGQLGGVWPRAHLIDARSRGGFSGGPCFIQRLVTRRWIDHPPEAWIQRARNFGTDVEAWGEVATFTDLWGVFVGWAEADGIGVVIPIEELFRFLESEMAEVIAKQRK